MHAIPTDHLIPFDLFENEPIKIDLVYANAKHPHNIFETALYHSEARMWAHKDLAAITLLTARLLNKQYGWVLELKDCLRTIEAQAIMGQTDIVKANPQWMEEPRMVSPPGEGAHPRAMAIDVCVLDRDNRPVDMGTNFDEMVPAAARGYEDLPNQVKQNRAILDHAFKVAADAFAIPILPIPPEWWDFRFVPTQYSTFEPLRDSDLPPQMQMAKKVDSGMKDFDDAHFQKLGKEISDLLDKHDGNLRAA